MLGMRKLHFAWIAGLATACTQEPARPSAPSAAQPPPGKPAALTLGQPVSAAPVALAEVAKDPRAFEGRALATSGIVTAVCQNMGCWMEIRDESSSAHVRMHGHSFFIPKTASGRHARVMATVVLPEAAKECDETPSPAGAGRVARVELDATGVELDL
jgi:hypothetical protein